jgi:hypothetical protein
VPIIPTLTGCGQHADQLFEIYQPVGADPYGSLAGAGYACREHLVDLVASTVRAGLTPLHMQSGPLGEWTCGESYEFETASRPDRPQLTHHIPVPGVPPVELPLGEVVPAAPEHPAWCVRAAICRVEGIHCSAPYPATPPGASVAVRLWIEQPAAEPVVPVVLVEVVGEYGRPVEHRLGVEQAQLLTKQIRLVLALAGI